MPDEGMQQPEVNEQQQLPIEGQQQQTEQQAEQRKLMGMFDSEEQALATYQKMAEDNRNIAQGYLQLKEQLELLNQNPALKAAFEKELQQRTSGTPPDMEEPEWEELQGKIASIYQGAAKQGRNITEAEQRRIEKLTRRTLVDMAKKETAKDARQIFKTLLEEEFGPLIQQQHFMRLQGFEDFRDPEIAALATKATRGPLSPDETLKLLQLAGKAPEQKRKQRERDLESASYLEGGGGNIPGLGPRDEVEKAAMKWAGAKADEWFGKAPKH